MDDCNGISFRMLKEDDLDEVVAFMLEHFVAEEPISKALPISSEEGKILFEPYMKNALWQNVSIGAYDSKTKELCGIRINLLGKNQSKLPPPDYKMEEQTIGIRQFDKIIIYLFGEDLSKTLGTGNYMELFLVAVRQDYGRRGITTELYKKSEKLAKDNGCSIMTVICTNAYTLRATTKLGYEVLKQIPYADYVDPITGKKILKDMPKPHVKLTVLTKCVN